MGSKVESDRRCAFCDAQMNDNAAYCSDTCFEINCEYLLIEISPKWVKSTLCKTEGAERVRLVKEYAKRHSCNFKLLKRKLKEKYDIDVYQGS